MDTLRMKVEEALRSPAPWFPANFLYDDAGNALYARLCESEEYDLARRESTLLTRFLACRREPLEYVIDLGCGSGQKVAKVFKEADFEVARYTGVDASEQALEELRNYHLSSAANHVETRRADLFEYLQADDGFAADAPNATLVLFLGTTIGNLSRDQRVNLLAAIRTSLPSSARLLVGCDMRKDHRTMLLAYSDGAGFAALSGLNALCQANKLFGSAVKPSSFTHDVQFNEATGDIETYLVAGESVRFEGGLMRAPIQLAAGARIRTNRSHKFTEEEMQDEASAAGLRLKTHWSDRSYVLGEYGADA